MKTIFDYFRSKRPDRLVDGPDEDSLSEASTTTPESKSKRSSLSSDTTLNGSNGITGTWTPPPPGCVFDDGSWRKARALNEKESGLFRMPDKILDQIFRKADFLSQQMIRQTCHRFSSVITDMNADRASEPFDDGLDERQVWPRHGSQEERDAVRRNWAALIRRDTDKLLCGKCRQFEESGQLYEQLAKLKEPISCFKCGTSHPRGMFPAEQRERTRFWGKRQCLLWSGRIRMCPHREYSWEEWQDYRDKMYYSGSHRLGIEIPQLSCPEGCAWQGCSNSLPEKWAPSSLSPSFVSTARQNRDQYNKYTLMLTWASHVFDLEDPKLPSPWTSASPSTPHLQRFKEFLNALDTNAQGPYLCPHMTPRQLISPIQPPFCYCFSDKEDCNTGYAIPRHRHTAECTKRCECAVGGGGNPSIISPTMDEFHHVVSCKACEKMFIWRKNGTKMHLECVNIITQNVVEQEKTTWWLFIQKMDPHSWDITQDEESKHVYWCPERDCKTNHEWRALYRRMGNSPKDWRSCWSDLYERR